MKIKLFESHSQKSPIFYLDSVSYSYLPSTDLGTNKLRELNRYLALNTDYDLDRIKFSPITHEFRKEVLDLVSEMFPHCVIQDWVQRVKPDYAATIHYKIQKESFEQLQIYIQNESKTKKISLYLNKGYFIFCTSYFSIWNSHERCWQSPPNVLQWSAWVTLDLEGMRQILIEVDKLFSL